MIVKIQDYYRIMAKIRNKKKLTESEKLIRNEITERPHYYENKETELMLKEMEDNFREGVIRDGFNKVKIDDVLTLDKFNELRKKYKK